MVWGAEVEYQPDAQALVQIKQRLRSARHFSGDTQPYPSLTGRGRLGSLGLGRMPVCCHWVGAVPPPCYAHPAASLPLPCMGGWGEMWSYFGFSHCQHCPLTVQSWAASCVPCHALGSPPPVVRALHPATTPGGWGVGGGIWSHPLNKGAHVATSVTSFTHSRMALMLRLACGKIGATAKGGPVWA